MDYATLVADKKTLGSIANWVNYTDTKIPVADILHEAQTYIFDRVRLTEMKAVRTIALATGAYSLSKPSDLLTVINFQDQNMIRIRPRDFKSLMDRLSFDSSGNIIQSDAPLFYTVTGTTFEFDMAPSADINLTLSGYFQPPFLGDGTSGTVTTNWLTDTYPHLLRTAILMFVADFLNDDGKYTRYAQRYVDLEKQAEQSSDMDMLGMQIDMDYSESRL